MPTATCTVSGSVVYLDGTPVVGTQVVATMESTDRDQGGQMVDGVGVALRPSEAFTDADGIFSLLLVRGARVLLEVPDIKLRKIITVPNVAAIDFAELI